MSNPFIANQEGYFQLSYHLPQNEAEYFGQAWIEAGALSVSFEDRDDYEGRTPQSARFGEPLPDGKMAVPEGEAALWIDTVVHILLPKTADCQQMALSVIARGAGERALLLAQKDIGAKDWLAHSRESFAPIVLDKLAVIAHWHRAPMDKTIINMDPGMAFGSGSHATTRMMLEWLERQEPLTMKGKRLFDYGCGSGILAIAAMKLFAEQGLQVFACDIDPTAENITTTNAIANATPINIVAEKDRLTLLPVDIVLANILLTPLLSLEQTFHALLQSGGALMMTGILAEQVEALRAHYTEGENAKHWQHFSVAHESEGWVLVRVLAVK